MKWVNAKKQEPLPSEEVLVRSKGIYNLAIYDHQAKAFTLRNGAEYSVDLDELEWVRLGQNPMAER